MSHPKLSLAAERVAGEDEFERHLAIAKEKNLGIEIQEFYLPDVMFGEWKERLDEYKRLLDGFQGELSIHNAFYSIDHMGFDPHIIKHTREKYDFIFMIAEELGCRYIVSHLTWNPFATDLWLRRWQDAEARFWEPYVERAVKGGYVLVNENTAEPRPEIIKTVVDIFGSDHFKFILDTGHAHLHSQVPLEEWITVFGRDLVYMHVHNNYRDYDSHNSVLKGSINFDLLFTALERTGIAPVITTEIYGDDLPESIDYLLHKLAHSPVYQDG